MICHGHYEDFGGKWLDSVATGKGQHTFHLIIQEPCIFTQWIDPATALTPKGYTLSTAAEFQFMVTFFASQS